MNPVAEKILLMLLEKLVTDDSIAKIREEVLDFLKKESIDLLTLAQNWASGTPTKVDDFVVEVLKKLLQAAPAA